MTRKAIIAAALVLFTLSGWAENKHSVEKGDTLWDISGKYYGDYWKWPVIWKSNIFINNPDLIYPKQNLNIPFLKGGDAFKVSGDSGIVKLEGSKYDSSGKNENFDADSEDALGYEPLIDSGSINAFSINAYEKVFQKKPEFKIVGLEKEKFFISTNEKFYINAGSKNGLHTGDTITVYSYIQDLETSYVYKVSGYGKVIKTEEDSSDVVLTKAFDNISEGFEVVLEEAKQIARPKGYMPDHSDSYGQIVYTNDNNRVVGTGQRIIFNAGVEKGFTDSLMVKILRERADDEISRSYIIAEAIILDSGNGYSTAELVKTFSEVKEGDFVYVYKSAVY